MNIPTEKPRTTTTSQPPIRGHTHISLTPAGPTGESRTLPYPHSSSDWQRTARFAASVLEDTVADEGQTTRPYAQWSRMD